MKLYLLTVYISSIIVRIVLIRYPTTVNKFCSSTKALPYKSTCQCACSKARISTGKSTYYTDIDTACVNRMQILTNLYLPLENLSLCIPIWPQEAPMTCHILLATEFISRRPAMKLSVSIPVMLTSPRSFLVHGTVCWPVVTTECVQKLVVSNGQTDKEWLLLFSCAYLRTQHTIVRIKAQISIPSSYQHTLSIVNVIIKLW